MKVAQACSSAVLSCSRETPVAAAARLLLFHGIESVPVLDRHRRVIGMAWERDLASALAHHPSASRLPVEGVMDRNIATCHPGEELRQVLPLMALLEASRIPVVDDRDRLSGTLSIADILVLSLVPGGIPGLALGDVIGAYLQIARPKQVPPPWAKVRSRVRVSPRAVLPHRTFGRSA